MFHKLVKLSLFPKLSNKMCSMFHTKPFEDGMTFQYLKSKWLSQEQKELLKLNKKIFLVLKELNCRYTKQTSKNIAGTTFKACVCYFSLFLPNGSPSIITKNAFYFIQKALFIVKIFKLLYFRLPLPVNHWLIGWWRINLKAYDVSNCLNENLITHFVCYLEKKNRYNIKLCQLIEY